MRNFFSLTILCCLFFVLLVPPVSAHIFQSDGTIGAILHTDPEDDPIAGEQSLLAISLKDRTNQLSPTNCDCSLQILQSGKALFEQPLFQTGGNTTPTLTNITAAFTFPTRGVYQVAIVGKPLTPNTFRSFRITYDLRVARQTTQQSAAGQVTWLQTHSIHTIGALFLFCVVIIAFIMQEKKRRKGRQVK